MALLLSLIAPTGRPTAKPRLLSMVITVTEGEHSRDSNSSTTSITLKGSQLHYGKAYAGYRASRRTPVDKTIQVRDEDLVRIQKRLVDNDLLRSRSSLSPTNQPGRYVEIEATIASGKQRSTLKFSGMRENVDKDALYAGLRALLSEIEELVNP